jgi:hypothetical protein
VVLEVIVVVVDGDEYDVIIEPSALKVPALHLGKSRKNKVGRLPSQCRPSRLTMQHTQQACRLS